MNYEKEQEIPFGAFDSELIHQEINIPEGFDATIDGNKIILKKIEPEDERIRKAIIELVRQSSEILGMQNQSNMIAWLEGQGEQNDSDVKDYNSIDPHFGKSIDKIEPNFNFKAGQWIVATGKCVYLITKIDGFNVTLVDLDGNEYVFDTSSLEDAHLWTIADAKDGGVLNDGTTIFIFKDLLSDGSVMSYCDYDTDSDESDAFCPLLANLMCLKITPSTKEQRDLLFQKMKEEGYEWDAEKKELKKINNEEVNGEDYGIDSLWHAKNILEETLGKVDGYQTDDGILEHKCAIAAVNKLYKQKPTWNQEDREYMESLLDIINGTPSLTPSEVECHKDWLKTLKQRIGG